MGCKVSWLYPGGEVDHSCRDLHLSRPLRGSGGSWKETGKSDQHVSPRAFMYPEKTGVCSVTLTLDAGGTTWTRWCGAFLWRLSNAPLLLYRLSSGFSLMNTGKKSPFGLKAGSGQWMQDHCLPGGCHEWLLSGCSPLTRATEEFRGQPAAHFQTHIDFSPTLLY